MDWQIILRNDGNFEQYCKKCNFPSTFCINMGQEEMKAIIIGAMCNPQYNFNVFSITKRLKSGWVLSINHMNIILTKGEKKIEFDIVIPMLHGAINFLAIS